MQANREENHGVELSGVIHDAINIETAELSGDFQVDGWLEDAFDQRFEIGD